MSNGDQKDQTKNDFWDDLTNSVIKGADWVVEKTNNFVDTGRLKYERAQLERECEKAYCELGQQFHQMIADDRLDTDILRAKCDQITELKAQIEAKKTAEQRQA